MAAEPGLLLPDLSQRAEQAIARETAHVLTVLGSGSRAGRTDQTGGGS